MFAEAFFKAVGLLADAAGVAESGGGALDASAKAVAALEFTPIDAALLCGGCVLLVFQWLAWRRTRGVGVPAWASEPVTFWGTAVTAACAFIFIPAMLLPVIAAANGASVAEAAKGVCENIQEWIFPISFVTALATLIVELVLLQTFKVTKELHFRTAAMEPPPLTSVWPEAKPHDAVRAWFDRWVWNWWSPLGCAAAAFVVLNALSVGIVLLGKWLEAQFVWLSLGLDKLQDAVVLVQGHSDDWNFLVMAALAICIGAPLAEEFFFRGLLYPFFKRCGGIWFAVCLNGLLFGAIHANAAAFLPLSLFGAYLCLAYERSGDLRVPIATHALFNTASLACSIIFPTPV